MDKFEQFGEVIVALDTLLPPGEAFRKNHIGLNKALMGMEMKGGGGGSSGAKEIKKQHKAQYKYDKKKYKYDYKQLKRQRNFAVKQNKIKRKELKYNTNRQNKMGQASADNALDTYNFQFDRQQEAFQKSEKLYNTGRDLVQKNKEQQLDYNRASYNISHDSIENQAFERYQKLSFKTTEALMKYQQGTEAGDLDYAKKVRGLEHKGTEASMKHQQGAEAGDLDYAKKVKGLEHKRTGASMKYQQDAEAGDLDYAKKVKGLEHKGTEASMKYQQGTETSDLDYAKKVKGLEHERTGASMEHQQGTEAGSLDYAKNLRGLEYKRTGAVMTQQAERAQAAQQGLTMKLQGMKAEGSARARGVQGRSNEKQIQASMAETGLKQSMLYDKITRSGFSFDAAIYGMETALRHTMAEESIRTKYSDLDYALKEKKLDASGVYDKSEHGLRTKYSGLDYALKKKELTTSGVYAKAEDSLRTKYSDLDYALKQKEFDASGVYDKAEHGLRTKYSDLDYALKQKELTTSGVYAKAEHGLRTKYSDLDYALKKKKIDATSLSISKAEQQAMRGAQHKWSGADTQANLRAEQSMMQNTAQRMIKPVAGPLPPKWTDLKVPTVLDPLKIQKGPKPIKRAAGSGSTTGTGTGGMVTAGLSAAAGVAMAGAAVTGSSALSFGTAALIAPWAAPVLGAAAIASSFIDW